jgi:DNA primase
MTATRTEHVRELWRAKASSFGDNRDVERVKDASDIVRVVGEHVALKPKGREYVGLCPFHDDHRPSMGVVPAKGIFHCFVCGAGGDVLSFIQRFHKMEFREALEYLAERAGITLTPLHKQADAPSNGTPGPIGRAELLAANSAANEFFKAILNHAEHGQVARALIQRRGISPEMVSQFQIGASPDRWDGLVLTAQKQGLPVDSLLQAGLLKRRDSGGEYDALRNRLIFPIQDQIGRVIAFGGRRINDADDPKYLNSPETRLFNKSATLYALNHAARAIQAARTAIITEGYTDVIACHQAGFANTVATLGTALTREHATVLSRLCDRVILLFDGDEAGQRAADRAVEVFFAERLDVSIATLNRFTDAKDPDELLKRENGADIFRAALAGAADLLDYRFARVRARLTGAGIAALSRAIDEEISRLAELGLKDAPPVRQRLIIQRLASLAGIDEATITRALPGGRKPRPADTRRDESAPDEARLHLPLIQTANLSASEHLLGCILCQGSLWATLGEDQKDFIAPAVYRWPLLTTVAQVMFELGEDGQVPDLAGVLRAVPDMSVKDAAVGLASRIDRETDRDSERLTDHWNQCLRRARLDRDSAERAPLSLIDQIELKRRLHSSIGKDLRRLPRPS